MFLIELWKDCQQMQNYNISCRKVQNNVKNKNEVKHDSK